MQGIADPRARAGSRLIVVLAGLLLVLIGIAALWMHAIDALHWSSPRGGYYLYLALLCIAAVAAMRLPRVAIGLLVLGLVDLSWGVGSYVLDAGDGRISLLPADRSEPARFDWHPTLQAVPIPSLRMVSAFGLNISHTSAGTRGPEPAPASLEGRTVIATYGGSTTYDIAVSDTDTWAARLGDALGHDRYFVVNNGVPGYTTAEHLLQTAFYQDKFGRTPRCAVYYVGWNDLRNTYIKGLDPGYADFHMPSQIDSLQLRRIGGSHRSFSPVLTMIERVAGIEFDSVRYTSDPFTQPMGSGQDPRLAAIFERNVRAISAINKQRGVTTIWVGQLVNRAALTSETGYGWLPLVRDRDIWPLLEGLRAVLAKVAGETGDTAVNLPPQSFAPADFADNGHFSVAGARRFAEALAPIVRDACR